jgi:hypothetical protein
VPADPAIEQVALHEKLVRTAPLTSTVATGTPPPATVDAMVSEMATGCGHGNVTQSAPPPPQATSGSRSRGRTTLMVIGLRPSSIFALC